MLSCATNYPFVPYQDSQGGTLSDTSTDGMDPHPSIPETITLESLAARLDILGQQMNWLCENMQSLFAFVQQMSTQGGGLRGMLQALRNGPPQLQDKVEVETRE